MHWSINGQSPEFLAATRMISLSDSIVKAIVSELGLLPGMSVLDVGCGSGEYCIRLGSAVKDVAFTGLDYDELFVEFANKRTRDEASWPFEAPNRCNSYRFVRGDGLNLPFDDETFDAVVSHTYLTAVPDYERALTEMRRVCKQNGTVSSVTNLTDNFYGSGIIGLFSDTATRSTAGSVMSLPANRELVERMNAVFASIVPDMPMTAGIAPRNVPAAFADAGLKDIRCRPLGQYFCLSDARTDPIQSRRYIELLHLIEHRRLAIIENDPRARSLIGEDEIREFARLADARRDELAAAIGQNVEWNWFGNASLLVCATR